VRTLRAQFRRPRSPSANGPSSALSRVLRLATIDALAKDAPAALRAIHAARAVHQALAQPLRDAGSIVGGPGEQDRELVAAESGRDARRLAFPGSRQGWFR
jgi:hypothetical protein